MYDLHPMLVSWVVFIGLWCVWLLTPLIPHLTEWLITHRPMTHNDVQTYLIEQGKFKTLNLYTCIYCQAFWVSVLQAVGYGAMTGQWRAIIVHVLFFVPFTTYALWKLKNLHKLD